jgi:hypothetical protein
MNEADRYRLLGRYRTPRFRLGQWVRCLIRGEVEVAGVHDGPIPWPVCKTSRRHAIIVYADLARAIRRESAIAVAHWWGVRQLQVWVWRKALGVGATTKGTSKLRSAYTREPWAVGAWAKAHSKAGDPARREKIAAAKRGVRRPWHVMEPAHEARRGSRHTEEARRRMSEAHRRRGTRPPKAGRAWTVEEDGLVRTLPAIYAAQQMGRTLGAVYCRRRELRGARELPDALPPRR